MVTNSSTNNRSSKKEGQLWPSHTLIQKLAREPLCWQRLLFAMPWRMQQRYETLANRLVIPVANLCKEFLTPNLAETTQENREFVPLHYNTPFLAIEHNSLFTLRQRLSFLTESRYYTNHGLEVDISNLSKELFPRYRSRICLPTLQYSQPLLNNNGDALIAYEFLYALTMCLDNDQAINVIQNTILSTQPDLLPSDLGSESLRHTYVWQIVLFTCCVVAHELFSYAPHDLRLQFIVGFLYSELGIANEAKRFLSTACSRYKQLALHHIQPFKTYVQSYAQEPYANIYAQALLNEYFANMFKGQCKLIVDGFNDYATVEHFTKHIQSATSTYTNITANLLERYTLLDLWPQAAWQSTDAKDARELEPEIFFGQAQVQVQAYERAAMIIANSSAKGRSAHYAQADAATIASAMTNASLSLDFNLDDADRDLLQNLQHKRQELKNQNAALLEQIKNKPQQYVNPSCTVGSNNNALLDSFIKNDLLELQVYTQQDIVALMHREYQQLYERAMFKLYQGKESSLWRYELTENFLALPRTPLQYDSKYYKQLLQHVKRQQPVAPASATAITATAVATAENAAGEDSPSASASVPVATANTATASRASNRAKSIRPTLSELGPSLALAPAQDNANTAVNNVLQAKLAALELEESSRGNGGGRGSSGGGSEVSTGMVSGPIAPDLRLTAALLTADQQLPESLQELANKAYAEANRLKSAKFSESMVAENEAQAAALLHQQTFYPQPDAWQQLVDLHGGAKLSYAQRIYEELVGIGQWRYVFGGHLAPSGKRHYVPWHILYPSLFYRALVTQMGDDQFSEDALFRLLRSNQPEADDVEWQNKFSLLQNTFSSGLSIISPLAAWAYEYIFRSANHIVPSTYNNFEHNLQQKVGRVFTALVRIYQERGEDDVQITQEINNILGLDINDLCHCNEYKNLPAEEDDDDDDDFDDEEEYDDDDDDDDFFSHSILAHLYNDDDEDEDEDDLEEDEANESDADADDEEDDEDEEEEEASDEWRMDQFLNPVDFPDTCAFTPDTDIHDLLSRLQTQKELHTHDAYDAQWRAFMLFLEELAYLAFVHHNKKGTLMYQGKAVKKTDNTQVVFFVQFFQTFFKAMVSYLSKCLTAFPSSSYMRPSLKNGFDFTQYIAGGAAKTIYTKLLQVSTNPEYSKFYASFKRLSELDVDHNLRILLVPDEHPDSTPYGLLNVPEHNLLVQNRYNYTADSILHPQALCLQLLHVQNTDSTANKISEFIRFLARLNKGQLSQGQAIPAQLQEYLHQEALSLYYYYEHMPRMKVYVTIGDLGEGLFDDITECTFVPRSPQDQADTKFLRAVPWLREIWRYICSLLGINVARYIVSHIYLVNDKAFDHLYHKQYQDRRVLVDNDILEDTENVSAIRFRSIEKVLEIEQQLQAAAAQAPQEKAATMPRHCALALLGLPLDQVTLKYSLLLQPMTGLFTAFNRQFTYAVNPQAFGFAPQLLPQLISRWRLDVYYGRSTCLPLVQEYYDGILQQHLHLQMAQGPSAASFYRQSFNQAIDESKLNTTTQVQGLSRIRAVLSQQIQEQGLESNSELSSQPLASSSPQAMPESENQISMKYLSNIGAHAGFVILPLPPELKTDYSPELWEGCANASDVSKGLEVEKLFSTEQLQWLKQLDQELRAHFIRNHEFNNAPQAVDYTGFAVGTSALYLDFLIWDLNQFPSVINDLKRLPLCRKLDLSEMYYHSFDVADELRLL